MATAKTAHPVFFYPVLLKNGTRRVSKPFCCLWKQKAKHARDARHVFPPRKSSPHEARVQSISRWTQQALRTAKLSRRFMKGGRPRRERTARGMPTNRCITKHSFPAPDTAPSVCWSSGGDQTIRNRCGRSEGAQAEAGAGEPVGSALLAHHWKLRRLPFHQKNNPSHRRP